MSAVRFVVFSTCLALAACSRAPVVSARTAHEPVTLTIGMPLVTGQNSINGIQQAVRAVSFEGLVVIGRDGRPQPRLAETWTESPDGLSWSFQLRKNAVFHDGSHVDSTAVKSSLLRT